MEEIKAIEENFGEILEDQDEEGVEESANDHVA